MCIWRRGSDCACGGREDVLQCCKMVNAALPEDLGSMGGRSYIHNVLQGRCAE